MSRLHTNTTAEIATSVRTGVPVRALCGYTRVINPDKHDSIYRTAQSCKHCDRISKNRYGIKELPRMPMHAILLQADHAVWFWCSITTNGVNVKAHAYWPPLAA